MANDRSIRLPTLTRLMLTEVAERRGVSDRELLCDLIRRAALEEFAADARDSHSNAHSKTPESG